MANENCAVLVIRARREAAHDFAAITEIPKGIPDEAAMERAFSEGRLLITEDADFGELVYAPDGRRRAAS